MFDMRTAGDTAHIDTILKFLPHTRQHGCIDILHCFTDPCLGFILLADSVCDKYGTEAVFLQHWKHLWSQMVGTFHAVCLAYVISANSRLVYYLAFFVLNFGNTYVVHFSHSKTLILQCVLQNNRVSLGVQLHLGCHTNADKRKFINNSV
jgi:hypothetical protein